MPNYLVEYKGKIIGSYNNYSNAETFILSCLQNNFINEFALIHCFRSNSCYKKKTYTVTLNNKNEKHLDDTTYSNESNESNDSDSSYETSSCNGTSESADGINTPNMPNPPNQTNPPNPPNTTNIKSISDINPQSCVQLRNANQKDKTFDYNNPAIIEMAKQKIELQHKINMLKIKKEKIEESKSVYENDLKLFNIFKESRQTDPNFIIPELFANKFEVMDKLYNVNNLSWENFITNYQHDNNYGDYFGTNNYEDMFVSPSPEETQDDTINEEFDINTDSD